MSSAIATAVASPSAASTHSDCRHVGQISSTEVSARIAALPRITGEVVDARRAARHARIGARHPPAEADGCCVLEPAPAMSSAAPSPERAAPEEPGERLAERRQRGAERQRGREPPNRSASRPAGICSTTMAPSIEPRAAAASAP